VDFELSDDQIALRDAAGALLEARSGPDRVRAVVDAGGGYDRDLWQDMVAQGWTGLLLPENRGGLGFGPVEAAVLAEQVGAHLAPAPFLQQLLALDTLGRTTPAGSSIEGLADGTLLGCAAFEPVSVEMHGDEFVLTGRTEPVVFAPSADVAVVRGRHGDDEALFSVDLTGVTVERESAMDLTREVGWLRFDRPPAARPGGADAVARFVDFGAMAYAAEMLGLAQAALDLSVAYAKEREQFGRPIGSFQAVKHRCADMLVDVEGMRSAVYYAAWAIGADVDASVAASTAKTWCSDASRRVMASTLQVHGGIGFTWEHDAHLFLKRSQLDEVSFGDARFHRARLARLLRARVEAGESVI
jgi:alkylation response protein AidB-like acyl-CoA dehydrogenase